MDMERTKKLTLDRALRILQLRYGTQVQKITRNKNEFIADSICNDIRLFTREDILNIENEMYSGFGC